jgi:signal peptidase I
MGEPVRDSRAQQPQPGSGREAPGALQRPKTLVREYVEAFAAAAVLALVIRTFILQAYKIPSGSMEPTLLIGDHILVNKLAYGLRLPDSLFGLQFGGLGLGSYVVRFGTIHRGDVVVFVFPKDRSKDFIKRVVAVANDQIEVRGTQVYINGQLAPDSHARYIKGTTGPGGPRAYGDFGPQVVPPGKLFVMGDNRDLSYDSRFWGFVDAKDVEGRALIIYWSWDTEDGWPFPVRWSRIGKLVN